MIWKLIGKGKFADDSVEYVEDGVFEEKFLEDADWLLGWRGHEWIWDLMIDYRFLYNVMFKIDLFV
mgnify:FL=1|jgi:hypothetical protein